LPALEAWSVLQIRDPDNEVRWYELTSSNHESVRLLVNTPQHGFVDFAPLGGERVTVRVSATRVVALSGSMSLKNGVVSGEMFVHLFLSQGGTSWLELQTAGVREGAFTDLVSELANASTAPLDPASPFRSDFDEESRRVKILEAERTVAGDVTDEPSITRALTRLQGKRRWPDDLCVRGTYSLPRLPDWAVAQFRTVEECTAYELTQGVAASALLFTCLLNPALYHLPKAADGPQVLLVLGSRSAIVTGQLTSSTTGAVSGSLSVQLLVERGGTERLLLKLSLVPRERAELLLQRLIKAPLKPFVGIDRDDTPWAYRWYECALVERLRRAKLPIKTVSTTADAMALLSSSP